jgi:5-formyltetrahydrofolate cyclo-ligase
MKEKLRKEIKEKRRKQTKEDNRKKSKEIKEKLFSLPEFKDAQTVLFYISYNGEVFTHDMILESFYKKNIIVPVSNPDKCTLTLSHLKRWEELSLGSYGILEPRVEKIRKTKVEDIDLIIAPGVAFDCNGNRLGHGKGYYDKLLKNTNTLIIALAFEFQIIKNIPIYKKDVPVDIIITEKRIIKCEKKQK